MITVGSWVTFRSPEDGKTYTGLVEKIQRGTAIATIAYQHDYGPGIGMFPQHEYLHVLKLTPAAEPVAG